MVGIDQKIAAHPASDDGPRGPRGADGRAWEHAGGMACLADNGEYRASMR
jgi:hypothetical protein